MRLETKRLILRPIEESDMEQLLALLKNDVIKQTYMIPDFSTEEEALRLARRFMALSQGEEKLVVGIALDGRLIGFLNETEKTAEEIEVGYALHPDFHGRGYMTEAFGAVIDHLLRLGFARVIAGAFEENTASIRVMEKCGMKRSDRTEMLSYRMKEHRCVYHTIGKEEEQA
ncbi:MAG: GNAT family N-acetyltransferase [Clostridia bacterium]|nr:GNAT family N-acetyltransferase [Clostridia bacterium]